MERKKLASRFKGTNQSNCKRLKKKIKNHNFKNKELLIISIREGLSLSTASNINQCQSQISHPI